MPRYIAFLRAINVGGHVVKMDHLRQLFESMGHADVETFIASGNVVFRSNAKASRTIEKQIEQLLEESLGYEVSTFVRTDTELTAIADQSPFPASDVAAALSFNIAFMKEPLDEPSRRKLMSLRSGMDDFQVHQREIYWLSRTRQSDSPISNMVLEKALGRRLTVRGVNTVKRMALKYPPSGR